MAITTVASFPDVRCGHRGALFVSVFHGWPNGHSLKVHADAQATVSAKFGKLLVLTIIPPISQASANLTQSDTERTAALSESARTGEKLQEQTIASAMVILPRGVLAVMIRSFMGAMSLLTRSTTPLKTFKELKEAIDWLESMPGAPKTPGVLQDIDAWLGVPSQHAAQSR